MKDVSLSCPRCGGEVRPPDLMHTAWRCDRCGEVSPLHVPKHISAELLTAVADRVRASRHDSVAVSLWCPWPLLPGWTVTGVGWAGDDRAGVRATALALSGPAPLADGPADAVLVAEEMGIGLGTSLAGIAGPDPGVALDEAVVTTGAHAKVKAAGHPTPLWAVASSEDRSVYVGEARGMWLYVIAWPASAGYLLAEEIVLHDLADSVPSELVFGAPSRRLRPSALEG
jgi:hypothetical protein